MSNEVRDNETFLIKVDSTPSCLQCNGSTLLLAQFPHTWKNGLGRDVSGLREAVLCPSCDHGDPAAMELLALYTVDGPVSPENLDVFGGLVAAWVESVRQRSVDEEALNAEFELWKLGEL